MGERRRKWFRAKKDRESERVGGKGFIDSKNPCVFSRASFSHRSKNHYKIIWSEAENIPFNSLHSLVHMNWNTYTKCHDLICVHSEQTQMYDLCVCDGTDNKWTEPKKTQEMLLVFSSLVFAFLKTKMSTRSVQRKIDMENEERRGTKWEGKQRKSERAKEKKIVQFIFNES